MALPDQLADIQGLVEVGILGEDDLQEVLRLFRLSAATVSTEHEPPRTRRPNVIDLSDEISEDWIRIVRARDCMALDPPLAQETTLHLHRLACRQPGDGVQFSVYRSFLERAAAIVREHRSLTLRTIGGDA